MARGRMISRTLSTSERYAKLNDEAGKLAEFCQSLYPLLVAHADDWGCQQGDTFTIKHAIHPTSPRKLAEFDLALRHLHNVGLVTWYEDDGKRHLYIRGFAAHQTLKGHDKDGRKRNHPVPPENTSDFDTSAQGRPASPKVPLRELKGTELKGTEPIRSPNEPATSGEDGELEAVKSETGPFIRAFCDLYRKHRSASYVVQPKKDVPLVRRLLAVYGVEHLTSLATVLLVTDDDWISKTDRGLGILSVKATWLDDRIAQEQRRLRGRTA